MLNDEALHELLEYLEKPRIPGDSEFNADARLRLEYALAQAGEAAVEVRLMRSTLRSFAPLLFRNQIWRLINMVRLGDGMDFQMLLDAIEPVLVSGVRTACRQVMGELQRSHKKRIKRAK